MPGGGRGTLRRAQPGLVGGFSATSGRGGLGVDPGAALCFCVCIVGVWMCSVAGAALGSPGCVCVCVLQSSTEEYYLHGRRGVSLRVWRAGGWCWPSLQLHCFH